MDGPIPCAVGVATRGLPDVYALLAASPGRLVIAGLLVAMALALAVLAARSLIGRDRARGGPTCRRLCRALGVRVAQRRRLERVARRAGVPSAASLLMSRGCYDAAVARYAAGPADADELAAVRRQVFE
jgi:hypothetical protein